MTSATSILLSTVLPYAAIVLFLAGIAWRMRNRFTVSSLSSQILESRSLVWGSVPFHLGVIILFLGHLIPLVAPQAWQRLVSNRTALLTVEAVGAAAAVLTLAGLTVLLVRRLGTPAIRAVSSVADVVVLVLLVGQVALGLGVALLHRWGAVWSPQTTTPYLRSVFTLQPAPEHIAGLPMLMMLHLAGAWILLALIPFTRLVHMFTLPLRYLMRPPQRVIWLSRRTRKPEKEAAPAPTTVPIVEG